MASGQRPQRVAGLDLQRFRAGDAELIEETDLQRLVIIAPLALEVFGLDMAEIELEPMADDDRRAEALVVDAAQMTGAQIEPFGVVAEGLCGLDLDGAVIGDGVVTRVRGQHRLLLVVRAAIICAFSQCGGGGKCGGRSTQAVGAKRQTLLGSGRLGRHHRRQDLECGGEVDGVAECRGLAERPGLVLGQR